MPHVRDGYGNILTERGLFPILIEHGATPHTAFNRTGWVPTTWTTNPNASGVPVKDIRDYEPVPREEAERRAASIAASMAERFVGDYEITLKARREGKPPATEAKKPKKRKPAQQKKTPSAAEQRARRRLSKLTGG